MGRKARTEAAGEKGNAIGTVAFLKTGFCEFFENACRGPADAD